MAENTGRYTVRSANKTYTVEPLSERNQKVDDVAFKNGGISGNAVKVTKDTGGSVRPEDSIITKENGYKRIAVLPPGMSPNGFIESLERCETDAERDALWEKYAEKE
jgi:hypothetical protein